MPQTLQLYDNAIGHAENKLYKEDHIVLLRSGLFWELLPL